MPIISRDPPDLADLVFADSSTRLRYKRPLVLRTGTWYNAGLCLDESESSLIPRFLGRRLFRTWSSSSLVCVCVCVYFLRELVLAAVAIERAFS